MLNSTRLLFTGSRDNDAPTSSLWKELSITALTGLLTMAVAVLFQIMPFYNILHDHYDIHSEVCVIVVIGLYITIAWAGDRKRTNTGKQGISIFSSAPHFQTLSVDLRDAVFLEILQRAFAGGCGTLLDVYCTGTVCLSS